MLTKESINQIEDSGRLLENLVYLHLRKEYKEIYYFSEKRECDFVVFNKAVIQEVVQVCFDLNADNLDRELDGVLEALAFFNKKEGKLITFRQKDRFEKDGRVIEVIPCHDFLQYHPITSAPRSVPN
jgi:predicted AAA+ superfamily ATPase